MMKLVFALVVLWHLCYSAPIDFNLNNEMIDRLNNINNAKVIDPSQHQFPTREMQAKAPLCVAVFIRELGKLLNNVRVPDGKKHIVDELNANLDALKDQQGSEQNVKSNCTMKHKPNTSLPFKQYINFIKALNSSKGK